MALPLWLLSIVVWAAAAVVWYSTRESHALIAGLTGSAMALGGFGCSQWLRNGSKQFAVQLFLPVMGFGGGYLIAKLTGFLGCA